MKERILVIDDDKDIAELIKLNLEQESYEVKCAGNGMDAMELFSRYEFHLVILDIMMPGIDGVEVCRRIRGKGNIPIIMLSAKDKDIDKVIALSMGADDYMTKPFSPVELTARVKAHLRRFLQQMPSSPKNNRTLRFGDMEIDIDGYQIWKNGKEIILTSKEMELLRFFASNPKRVFTKAQIFEGVWGDAYFGGDNTINVHIRRLRNKIEDEADHPSYIKTVWGIGYKFDPGESK